MAQAGQIPTSPSDGENYFTFLLTVSNTGGQVLVQPPGFALPAPGLAHVHLALERFLGAFLDRQEQHLTET